MKLEELPTMRRIVRAGLTIEKAERFQNSLYNKYDHVQLTRFPAYWQAIGEYCWEVY